jgi:hypothetical protein
MPLKQADPNTRFGVEDREDGFVLVVEFSQRAFVPKSDIEMRDACMAALTSLAGDEADRRGRRLQPIDPSTVRVSSGRNGITGHNTCSARGRFFFH